ncbi:MAG: SAM-dependent methyltransferase [Deltaproteobacteria bacterium]|nr:SAM-dependent methyltransferase [Deltaproteobacteria bacterium]
MKPLDSSFRDPHGFLTTHEGKLYRIVTEQGREDYDLLIASRLYERLRSSGKMVGHLEEADLPFEGAYKVLAPEIIPFISYPYEWSFSQLQDAALLTLAIQKEALNHGLSLKDASFFNVQFIGSRPIFIDTLSFEKREDTPWVAYRQFCQHFLGPLLLMKYRAPDFNRHLRSHLDGFPLSFIASLLPLKAKFKSGVLMHILLHAGSQKKHENCAVPPQSLKCFGLQKQLALIDHLESLVRSLKLPVQKTEWGDYTSQTQHYCEEAMNFKKEFVSKALTASGEKTVWDLGGNTGDFSRLAAEKGMYAVCFDQDPLCVEKNYRAMRTSGSSLLPLLLDLGNPTPAIGWGHTERMSLLQRSPAGVVLALALMHHLRITANIPLKKMAVFLSQCTGKLIIEFVPKDDPMARILTAGRKDIFDDYTEKIFQESFAPYFPKWTKAGIPGSQRVLYSFSK